MRARNDEAAPHETASKDAATTTAPGTLAAFATERPATVRAFERRRKALASTAHSRRFKFNPYADDVAPVARFTRPASTLDVSESWDGWAA